jgi:hypothetical protein
MERAPGLSLLRLWIEFTPSRRGKSDIRNGGAKKRRELQRMRSRRYNDKKNKHRCQLGWSSHPQDHFTAVVSVFQAHLPVHRSIDSDAKASGLKKPWLEPFAKKVLARCHGQRREIESDNTGPLASHRKIDSLDSHSASCNRLRGC